MYKSFGQHITYLNRSAVSFPPLYYISPLRERNTLFSRDDKYIFAISEYLQSDRILRKEKKKQVDLYKRFVFSRFHFSIFNYSRLLFNYNSIDWIIKRRAKYEKLTYSFKLYTIYLLV